MAFLTQTDTCSASSPPAFSSRVHLLKQEGVPPGGCTMATVGHSCEVHLLVRGLVDVEKESARLEDKVGKISAQLEKLAEIISREGYTEKVRGGAGCGGGHTLPTLSDWQLCAILEAIFYHIVILEESTSPIII